jgi:small subunit ribosomal protein S9
MADEPDETTDQPPADESAAPAQPEPTAEASAEPSAEEQSPTEEQAGAERQAAPGEPVAGVQQDPPSEQESTAPAAEQPESAPVAETPTQESAEKSERVADESSEEEEEAEVEATPRVKPSVPGAHLEVDIVPEGVDPLAPEQPADPYAIEDYEVQEQAEQESEGEGEQLPEPISTAAIDLAAGARYKATGKRKTAIARVILRPGSGTYLVNGRKLDEHFPRATLQRNIRQPLETVGYQERMDVVARLHGGGISAQAGALRHGISRALLEADPNLRGELKRRGFLTRDSRAKERKKAGLKKARKRPQFSKR